LHINADVYLIIPDEHSVTAIDLTPYDPTCCGITAIAGREKRAAPLPKLFWLCGNDREEIRTPPREGTSTIILNSFRALE
jgi:hypothetical protein